LYSNEILKIPANDNIFWYIVWHDGITSPIILIVTSGLDSINLIFSGFSVKNIFQFKRYPIKSKINLWVMDFFVLLCISIGIVIFKLDNIPEINSIFKIVSIGWLLIIVYVTKLLIFIAKHILKSLFTPFGEFISLSLRLPATFYNNTCKDISTFPLPKKTKRFLKTFVLIWSLALLLYIIAAIVVSLIIGILSFHYH
jgi:hypothetical protein